MLCCSRSNSNTCIQSPKTSVLCQIVYLVSYKLGTINKVKTASIVISLSFIVRQYQMIFIVFTKKIPSNYLNYFYMYLSFFVYVCKKSWINSLYSFFMILMQVFLLFCSCKVSIDSTLNHHILWHINILLQSWMYLIK